jgi:hypothetical protein
MANSRIKSKLQKEHSIFKGVCWSVSSLRMLDETDKESQAIKSDNRKPNKGTRL